MSQTFNASQPRADQSVFSASVPVGPGYKGELPEEGTLCSFKCGRPHYIMRNTGPNVWVPCCVVCFVTLAKKAGRSSQEGQDHRPAKPRAQDTLRNRRRLALGMRVRA